MKRPGGSDDEEEGSLSEDDEGGFLRFELLVVLEVVLSRLRRRMRLMLSTRVLLGVMAGKMPWKTVVMRVSSCLCMGSWSFVSESVDFGLVDWAKLFMTTRGALAQMPRSPPLGLFMPFSTSFARL